MGLNPRLREVRRLARDGAPVILAAAAVAVLALVLLVGGTGVRDLLSFDRSGVVGGQVWRLVSGHTVHLGPSHAMLNVAGVVLVAILVGREYSLRQWALISLAIVAFIDAGLWWFNPELEWYVGLSGVLHGWLAAGIVGSLAQRRPDAWLLAALIIAKLVFEQWQGPVPGSAETAGGPVVVDAHLYGAFGGALAGLVVIWLDRAAARSA